MSQRNESENTFLGNELLNTMVNVHDSFSTVINAKLLKRLSRYRCRKPQFNHKSFMLS